MKCVELSEREKRFLHRAKNKNGEAFLYIQEEVEDFKQMIEARAEKAEAINKKIWEALCENCQYYCLFKCRYEKGDETCKGCVSTDSHTCPSAEYETCPIVAKAKEGL